MQFPTLITTLVTDPTRIAAICLNLRPPGALATAGEQLTADAVVH